MIDDWQVIYIFSWKLTAKSFLSSNSHPLSRAHAMPATPWSPWPTLPAGRLWAAVLMLSAQRPHKAHSEKSFCPVWRLAAHSVACPWNLRSIKHANSWASTPLYRPAREFNPLATFPPIRTWRPLPGCLQCPWDATRGQQTHCLKGTWDPDTTRESGC